ncbi:MAG: folylpolyglutamate synthase/dihydrofolate synthase family protein [Pseudomonadota bacterium]
MRSDTSDVLLDRLLTLHPKIIDLTLDRVWRLLEDLQSPERDLPPVVHIAGTNGKGSTQAMIRAGLEAAGHRVHAYTSPHLVRFHERIRLAGDLIGEDHLAALLAECETANGGKPITFFEITTVAAMLAFARTPADYTLLEVGLGGRLDATNVVDRPAITAITPISFDHQQFLGETIEEIAAEKAGIMKPDVPCVIAPQSDAVLSVLREIADRVGAPLRVHGEDWLVRTEHGRLVYQDQDGLLDLDPPRLPGLHQQQNAGTAIAVLRHLGADDAACQAALLRADWPARMQRITSGPLLDALPDGSELWLDGGHNAAAGEAIAAVLDDWHAAGTEAPHLIVGMLETKTAEDFLRPLAPRTAQMVTVAIPDTQATYTAETLAEIAQSVGALASAAPSVEEALSKITKDSTAPVRVLICGSLYLAGHVLGRASDGAAAA